MSYLVVTPIPWVPFAPPPTPAWLNLRDYTMCRVVMYPGITSEAGLDRMLGPGLVDRCVDMGILEPIP